MGFAARLGRMQPRSSGQLHGATRPRQGLIPRATASAGPASSATGISIADSKSREFALACARVVDETKCQDISVLHVAPHVSWTSYMVFATVFSRPQLQAAIARIEAMVEERYAATHERRNQPGSSPWECLDYGDAVVHLLTAEQRDIYDIEGFYAAAEEVDLPWTEESITSTPASSAAPAWTKQA